MADSGGSKLWTVFSLVSALGAAALAKKALDTGWKAATGKTPPANPADPDVQMAEAYGSAIDFSGIGSQLGRCRASYAAS